MQWARQPIQVSCQKDTNIELSNVQTLSQILLENFLVPLILQSGGKCCNLPWNNLLTFVRIRQFFLKIRLSVIGGKKRITGPFFFFFFLQSKSSRSGELFVPKICSLPYFYYGCEEFLFGLPVMRELWTKWTYLVHPLNEWLEPVDVALTVAVEEGEHRSCGHVSAAHSGSYQPCNKMWERAVDGLSILLLLCTCHLKPNKSFSYPPRTSKVSHLQTPTVPSPLSSQWMTWPISRFFFSRKQFSVKVWKATETESCCYCQAISLLVTRGDWIRLCISTLKSAQTCLGADAIVHEMVCPAFLDISSRNWSCQTGGSS